MQNRREFIATIAGVVATSLAPCSGAIPATTITSGNHTTRWPMYVLDSKMIYVPREAFQCLMLDDQNQSSNISGHV